MTTIFKTFYYLFTVALIAIGGLLLVSILPIPGNVEMKIVQSGSMEPYLPVGSLVIIKPALEYRAGDVVTFGPDTKTQVPTTHRIVEARSEAGAQVFTTKGDANEEADPEPVARQDIIGKVIAHVPVVGYLLDFARTPFGFALLVGVPALMVIVDEALTIFREVVAHMSRRREMLLDSDVASNDGVRVAGALGKVRHKVSRVRVPDVGVAHRHNVVHGHEACALIRQPILDGVVRVGRIAHPHVVVP